MTDQGDRGDAPGRPPAEQWWVINGADLLAALVAAHQGSTPDVVYLELVANSEAEPS